MKPEARSDGYHEDYARQWHEGHEHASSSEQVASQQREAIVRLCTEEIARIYSNYEKSEQARISTERSAAQSKVMPQNDGLFLAMLFGGVLLIAGGAALKNIWGRLSRT